MEPHVPGSLGRAVPSPVTMPRTTSRDPFTFIASTAGFIRLHSGWAYGLAFTGNYGAEWMRRFSRFCDTYSLRNRSHISIHQKWESIRSSCMA